MYTIESIINGMCNRQLRITMLSRCGTRGRSKERALSCRMHLLWSRGRATTPLRRLELSLEKDSKVRLRGVVSVERYTIDRAYGLHRKFVYRLENIAKY
jgi:hypothetical protein